jgi:hypothetical protein
VGEEGLEQGSETAGDASSIGPSGAQSGARGATGELIDADPSLDKSEKNGEASTSFSGKPVARAV